MPRSLATLVTQFLSDPAKFKASFDYPVLIWDAPPADASDERWQATMAGQGPSRPNHGEALIYDLRKEPGKLNAFPMGVTVGRIETNDVALDDLSISRFHAWFTQRPQGWVLRDAESANGTWLDGKKLAPKEEVIVPDGAHLKFGDVEVRFVSVVGLVALIQKTMAAKS